MSQCLFKPSFWVLGHQSIRFVGVGLFFGFGLVGFLVFGAGVWLLRFLSAGWISGVGSLVSAVFGVCL